LRLFCDTSVLLSASISRKGASRLVLEVGDRHNWILYASPYVLNEVRKHLPDLPLTAAADWSRLEAKLLVVPDILTSRKVTVFEAAKDKPILFTALEHAQVLLTLDRRDFGRLGDLFYGLEIMTPGNFLEREKELGNFDSKRWPTTFS
jgi:predicted nucleic acid-binding protein